MFNTQADRIYIQKGKLGSLINNDTIKEEIDSVAELHKIDDNSGDENLHRELIVNNVSKVENTLSQMEQWSILSNVRNYHSIVKLPRTFTV